MSLSGHLKMLYRYLALAFPYVMAHSPNLTEISTRPPSCASCQGDIRSHQSTHAVQAEMENQVCNESQWGRLPRLVIDGQDDLSDSMKMMARYPLGYNGTRNSLSSERQHSGIGILPFGF